MVLAESLGLAMESLKARLAVDLLEFDAQLRGPADR